MPAYRHRYLPIRPKEAAPENAVRKLLRRGQIRWCNSLITSDTAAAESTATAPSTEAQHMSYRSKHP
jgi:hypothetical protein